MISRKEGQFVVQIRPTGETEGRFGRIDPHHLRLGARDRRGALCATCACVGRWKRPACPIASRACRFATASDEHFAHQPFGQVPWLTDGDISIFESGAILLHLGERSAALMPADPRRRSEAMEWLFAALNSVEMASLPWSIFGSPATERDAGVEALRRLPQRAGCNAWSRCWRDANGWPGAFSIADILMADVLRLVDRFDGLAETIPPAALCRARHGAARLRQGACRPDGAFRGGGLSDA